MENPPPNMAEDAAAEPASKQPGRGRVPGRPFVKGISGNPSRKHKGEEPPDHLEPRANESQLDAMRWVLVHPSPRRCSSGT